MAEEDLLRGIINGRLDNRNPTTREILKHSKDETIRKAYAKLKELGLTDEKIASQAHLLGMNPETIQRNADALKKLGLTDEKIATLAHLLSRDPETIQRNADALRKLGLTDEKIATLAHLLSRDPETIQRNYEFLRRFFSKDEIMENAQLLGYSQKTVFAHVSYLHALEIDYKQFRLVTTPACKRKKIAVLLREKYGYDTNLSDAEKRELIEKAKEFVRSRPRILRMSERAIRKKYC